MPTTRRWMILNSLGLIAAMQMPRAAEAAAWRVLGQKTVSLGVDRDVIKVAPWTGKIDKIKIQVALNDIEMIDLAIVYGNGRRDDIPVRRIIRKNSETGPLDLRGEGRNIVRVEMIYRKNPAKAITAVVTVLGRDA